MYKTRLKTISGPKVQINRAKNGPKEGQLSRKEIMDSNQLILSLDYRCHIIADTELPEIDQQYVKIYNDGIIRFTIQEEGTIKHIPLYIDFVTPATAMI